MIALPSILAALVTPSLFLGGLAAVAIPILIHLLAKRRFRRIRWAAMSFLLDAERENRRWLNLRELILLVLRCLAMVGIGLLLARPFAAPGHLAGVFGQAARREHVMVLDDSLSMTHTVDGRQTFDQARDLVAQRLAECRQQAPEDRVVLLTTSTPDTALLDGVRCGALPDGTPPELATLLPRAGRARFDRVLGMVRDRLLSLDAATPATLTIVSDFQAIDWIDPQAPSDQRSSLGALADWPEERTPPTVLLVQAGAERRDNLAVTALSAERNQVIWGVENRLQATVTNFAAVSAPEQDLEVLIDDASQQTATVPALGAGEATTVSFGVSFPSEGQHTVAARIAASGLVADDERSAVFDVLAGLRVLIINGEPGPGRLEDEVGLLETALSPEGDVPSGIHVRVADESHLDDASFDDAHVILLANVFRIEEPVFDRLQRFVEDGGGLGMFLGDQVEAESYNRVLWRDGGGLMPCALGAVEDRGPQPAHLRILREDHPVVQVFAGEDNPFLQSVAVERYLECTPDPSVAATTTVLAAYDSDPDHAAIVERRSGRGRVVVVTTSADLEWTDWPKSTSYVVTQLELVQHLAREGIVPPATIVEQPLRIAAPTGQPGALLAWQDATYPVTPARTVAAEADGADRAAWFVTPRTLGRHRFSWDAADGVQRTMGIAVVPAPEESRLASCDVAALRAATPGVAFEFVNAGSAVALDAAARRELWPAVMAVLVALLMIEQFLACWFGRH